MTQMIKDINGVDIYANRAVNDKDGNQIDTTYAKESELSEYAKKNEVPELEPVNNPAGSIEYYNLKADENNTPILVNRAECDRNGFVIDVPNFLQMGFSISYLENDIGYTTENGSYANMEVGYAYKAFGDEWGQNIIDTYARKEDIPSIPTNVSSFENDAGYLTQSEISGKQDKLTATVDIKIAASEEEAQSHTSDNILYLVPEASGTIVPEES